MLLGQVSNHLRSVSIRHRKYGLRHCIAPRLSAYLLTHGHEGCQRWQIRGRAGWLGRSLARFYAFFRDQKRK